MARRLTTEPVFKRPLRTTHPQLPPSLRSPPEFELPSFLRGEHPRTKIYVRYFGLAPSDELSPLQTAVDTFPLVQLALATPLSVS